MPREMRPSRSLSKYDLLDRQSGQSTVEFALVLPLIVVVLLSLMQAWILLKDQLILSGAAREAAREAAVTADSECVLRAAQRSAPDLDLAMDIDRGAGRGDPVKVRMRASPTSLPLVGVMVARLTLSASATMRIERDGRG